MELNDFNAKLKSGAIGESFAFVGEEEYLKRYYLQALRSAAVTDPTLASFNHFVFDGEDVDFGALTDAIQSPPMMSDFKMVEWRYADFSSMSEKELTAMEELLELQKRHSYTALAFIISDGCADLGTDKRPGKFLKRFGSRMNVLRFDRSTDSQLYSWLKKHFDAEGVGVSLEVLKALVFRSGHSMDVLLNEVRKLSALAKARGLDSVTSKHVEEVSASTPECDTFALSNAIIDRNKKGAFAALEEMKIRRVDPITVIAMMIKTYSDLCEVALLLDEGMGSQDIAELLKMNVYKLRIYASAAKKQTSERLCAVLNKLSEMDVSSKYGGIQGYTAVELFVSKYL